MSHKRAIDWVLLVPVLLLVGMGLVTMINFTGATEFASSFFWRQMIWLLLGLLVFLITQTIRWDFLNRTNIVLWIFFITLALLSLVFVFGTTTLGATSRFQFGGFFVQPSDPAKLALILLLAKYFSKRHAEIANYRHIIVSGLYAFSLFLLLFFQPDFGGSIIIFFIWFGMILVSGISKKHLIAIFLLGAISFSFLWGFVFADYQKARIMTFLNPLTDLQGAGYNAYQSTVAVGSGALLGKGFGYGTQSRLQFLPEYETDFIFAAFSEEWGFVGAFLVFVLFGIIIWRTVRIAYQSDDNFISFFALGVAILFISQFIVHVGMNIGLLPVTGITMPFMSYGGSHLITEFLALGILTRMGG